MQVAVPPARVGVVAKVDTRAIGMVVVALGGGRTRPQDPVDHAVGLTGLAGPGDAVGPDRPLAVIHARSAAQAEQAADLVRAAYRVGPTTSRALSPAKSPVIDRITA